MKKNLLISILALLYLASCSPNREMLSDEARKAESEKVKNVAIAYNKAVEEKNFGNLVETLADEVIFFGTDSSEIINTFADFKKSMEKQWQQYDKVKYGDLHDVSVQMDNEAQLATIIFGVNADITHGGITENFYLRAARILVKQDNKWVIKSGIMGIVRNPAPVPVATPMPEAK